VEGFQSARENSGSSSNSHWLMRDEPTGRVWQISHPGPPVHGS
jgi:hypothetical protein